jgi:hypothetical protein
MFGNSSRARCTLFAGSKLAVAFGKIFPVWNAGNAADSRNEIRNRPWSTPFWFVIC